MSKTTYEEAKAEIKRMQEDFKAELERANKKPWHAPQLRQHGTVTDKTREQWDDPLCPPES